MDLKDMKLLFELNWNCRQSNTALGKKLRTSKQVVDYRIKRLERERIIRSYHALIDWRRMGYNSIRVYLKWHNIPQKTEERVYKEMRRDPFFMWTVKFEGEFDVGFYLWVQSIPEFSKKWFGFIGKYRKYILRQEIYESVEMVHYPMKTLSEKFSTDEKVIGGGSRIDYDKTDYRILEAVTENARMPITEISRRIDLTPKAAIYRLRNLEKKGIILGYNTLLDTNRLGYNFYKVDFYLSDFSRMGEMFEFAKQNKNIVYRMRTIGGPDFEIEVMVRDVKELKEVINEIKKKFSKSIEVYRFHRFEYTIKQVYLPGE